MSKLNQNVTHSTLLAIASEGALVHDPSGKDADGREIPPTNVSNDESGTSDDGCEHLEDDGNGRPDPIKNGTTKPTGPKLYDDHDPDAEVVMGAEADNPVRGAL